MNKLPALIVLFILIGCGWIQPEVQADDGFPVGREVSMLSSEHKNLTPNELFSWGIEAYSVDVSAGEYVLYVHLTEALETQLSAGNSEIHFSLFDKSNNLILGLPKIVGNRLSFIIAQGYKLRIMVVSKADFNEFKAGMGYYSDLDPVTLLRQ